MGAVKTNNNIEFNNLKKQLNDKIEKSYPIVKKQVEDLIKKNQEEFKKKPENKIVEKTLENHRFYYDSQFKKYIGIGYEHINKKVKSFKSTIEQGFKIISDIYKEKKIKLKKCNEDKKNLDKLLDSVNGENVTDYNLISANFEEINNYYSNIKKNCNVNLLKNKIDEKIKVLEKFYKIDIDRHVKECLDDVLNEIDPDGDGVISDIELDIDNDGVISDLDEKQFISRINDIVKKKCTHPKKIPLDKLAKEIGIIFNKRLKTQDKKGAGYKIIYGGGNSSNNLKNISNEIKINSN